MRFVVLGAGAIGSALGGRLFEHGHDVVLVARGANLETLREDGLTIRDPDRTVHLRLPAVSSPAEAEITRDDVVVLATKTQDSEPALVSLAASAPPAVAVVCAQNGVENERLALRRFDAVYAMCVILPSTHLEPGVVDVPVAPLTGICDLGRYPSGVDDLAEQIASALRGSTFDSRADPQIMARKYAKLLSNVGNAVEAVCGSRTGDEGSAELFGRARAEARACFEAAGIAVADLAEEAERRKAFGGLRPVGGVDRVGASSWQSLARSAGSIESDWLNGEIALLGRLHGVPTPVNSLLQRVADQLAIEHGPPGSIPAVELLARL